VTTLRALWGFLQRATGGERSAGVAIQRPTVRGVVRAVGRALWLFVLLQITGFFAWNIWRVLLGAAGIYDEGVIALVTLPTIVALAVWYFRQRRRTAALSKASPTASDAHAVPRLGGGVVFTTGLVLGIGLLIAGAIYAWRALPAFRAPAEAPREAGEWRHSFQYWPEEANKRDDYECDREATSAAQDGTDAQRRLYAKCMIARGYVWR